jgi:hypothetical protein
MDVWDSLVVIDMKMRVVVPVTVMPVHPFSVAVIDPVIPVPDPGTFALVWKGTARVGHREALQSGLRRILRDGVIVGRVSAGRPDSAGPLHRGNRREQDERCVTFHRHFE